MWHLIGLFAVVFPIAFPLAFPSCPEPKQELQVYAAKYTELYLYFSYVWNKELFEWCTRKCFKQDLPKPGNLVGATPGPLVVWEEKMSQ